MKAEDLKGCDDETKELMRDIVNEIIKQESMAPKSTIEVAIMVIYKKVMRRDQKISVQRRRCTKCSAHYLTNRLHSKLDRF